LIVIHLNNIKDVLNESQQSMVFSRSNGIFQ